MKRITGIMKKLIFLSFFLILAASAYAQINTGTAYRIFATSGAPTTCAYSATADPVVVYAGTLYVCGVGNTFVAGGGLGSVVSVGLLGTANQITVTGTSPITTSGSWTLSLPAAIALGVDNTTAGTLTLANNGAAAHTIWASGATTSNTIKGFTVAPTDGHLVTCTVSGTTCTLTDGGAVPTGTVTSSGSPGQYDFAYFTTGTNLTKVTAPTANGYYFYGANVIGSAAVAPTATASNALPSGTAVGDSTSYFTFGSSSITPNVTITGSVSGNAGTATDLASYTSYSVFGAGNAAKAWITPSANGQCLMSGVANYATTTPSFQTCPTTGAFPAGSGSELQFRSSGTTFGAVPGSVVDGTTGLMSLTPPDTTGAAAALTVNTAPYGNAGIEINTTNGGGAGIFSYSFANDTGYPNGPLGGEFVANFTDNAGVGGIATGAQAAANLDGTNGAGDIAVGLQAQIQSTSSSGIPVELSAINIGKTTILHPGLIQTGIHIQDQNLSVVPAINVNAAIFGDDQTPGPNVYFLKSGVGPADFGDILSPGIKLLGWQIGPITFTGVGLNDMTTSGFNIGLTSFPYCVQIDGTAPDTFEFSWDNCATWTSTLVAITGAPQELKDRTSITFGAAIGHTLGDRWTFLVAASPGDGYEFNASDADTPVTEGAECSNVGDHAGARAIYMRGDLICF